MLLNISLSFLLRGDLIFVCVWQLVEVNFVLDVEEATNSGSADRALVGLHSDYLAAVNTQTHVSAWQHHSVFVGRVADNTLFLALIGKVGSVVINSIDVIEVHYLVVVQQLLTDVLEADVVGAVSLELSIRELNVSLSSTGVVLWVHRLNRNDNGVEVLSDVEQVFLSTTLNTTRALVVLAGVNDEQL